MPKIHQLSLQEAHKIAAGQVVERPANIVKELIENALDANATQIVIHIADGGKALVRVVDNGCGMDYEDAQLCFAKHATSKIRSVDELAQLTTFGFRGEALASIAAVSNVTLITKTADMLEAVRVTIHDGEQIIEPTSSITGTDIIIENLFYNTPGRLKFLKTAQTETRQIIQIIQACALVHLAVHFTLIIDGKTYFNCAAVTTLQHRCAQLFDDRIVEQLCTVDQTRADNSVAVVGQVTNHQYGTYDRNQIFIFVNKRWVKNYKLASAVLKGYQNVLQPGKFPFAVLSIAVDPSLVDINVHPRKEEVAFVHPRIVEQLIETAVYAALQKRVTQHLTAAPEIASFAAARSTYWHSLDEALSHESLSTPLITAYTPDSTHSSSSPFQQKSLYSSYNEHVQKQQITSPQLQSDTQQSVATPCTQAPFVQERLIAHEQLQDTERRIIGQFNKTYIIVEQPEGMYLVDQHAAHERILYELFSQRFDSVATVQLLFAHIIPIARDDIALLVPFLPLLQEYGIAAEQFGADQLIIQATPVYLKDCSLNDLIEQVIVWIKEYSMLEKEEFTRTMSNKLCAQMACKAAVKAGDILSIEQMTSLLDDLAKTPNRLTCPHGRPTGWLIGLDDIKRKFKRDYKN